MDTNFQMKYLWEIHWKSQIHYNKREIDFPIKYNNLNNLIENILIIIIIISVLKNNNWIQKIVNHIKFIKSFYLAFDAVFPFGLSLFLLSESSSFFLIPLMTITFSGE